MWNGFRLFWNFLLTLETKNDYLRFRCSYVDARHWLCFFRSDTELLMRGSSVSRVQIQDFNIPHWINHSFYTSNPFPDRGTAKRLHFSCLGLDKHVNCERSSVDCFVLLRFSSLGFKSAAETNVLLTSFVPVLRHICLSRGNGICVVVVLWCNNVNAASTKTT